MKPRLDIKAYPPIVTELPRCVESTPSPEMSPRVKRIDPPGPCTDTTNRSAGLGTGAKSQSPTSPTQTKRSRRETVSRPTSATNPSSHSQGHRQSQSHSRSASRSTVRSSPNSRRSSIQSARRTVPNTAIVPVPTTRTSPQERRESLIALHRESCRLFQDEALASKDLATDVQINTSIHAHTRQRRPSLQRHASSTTYPRRDSRASTSAEKGSGTSEPSSPIAPATSFTSFRFEPEAAAPFLTSRDRSHTMPSQSNTTPLKHHHHSPSASSIHVPATVMEWTSPSTRRREYEKIDRASSGMRGLWRRVAPRCFQTRESRTGFFEEGKTEREGSVRRFRMDIPEDEAEAGVVDAGKVPLSPGGKSQVQLLDFLSRHTTSTSNSGYHISSDGPRRRWACLRSKTSPLPTA
jgi:hypothetical protein